MTDDSNISITINGTNCTVLCGQCKTPIRFITEAEIGNTDTKRPAKAGCGRCNNTDSVEQISRIAIEYAKDEGQLILNRAMRDVAKGSGMMSFKGKTTHNKRHRFVVEL